MNALLPEFNDENSPDHLALPIDPNINRILIIKTQLDQVDNYSSNLKQHKATYPNLCRHVDDVCNFFNNEQLLEYDFVENILNIILMILSFF